MRDRPGASGSRTGCAPTTPVAESLLSLDRLGCAYGAQPVVDDVSFALAPGELACLLGPSGGGKTTLLRTIAGFHAPAGGRVLLRGADAARLAPHRRGVGYVVQDLALFPHLRVDENLAFGLNRLPPRERVARIEQTLALLHLEPYARRHPHALSGGQRQRVALARSLAPRPDLLLLDEPFSSLDAGLRARLRDELRALLQRLGIAALLVTHDQDEAFAFADTVGVLIDGRLRQWDARQVVQAKPADSEVAAFLGIM